MKVFTKTVSNILNNTKNRAQILKTEPYPSDCFKKTCNLSSKKTFGRKFLMP